MNLDFNYLTNYHLSNMKRIFLVIFLIASSQLYAQGDCDCQKNFDEMYQKVRDNYSAYSMKVTPQNKAKFDNLSKKMKDKSAGIKDPKTCFLLLKEWTEFFEDGHLFINTQTSFNNDDPAEVVQARAAKSGSQKYASEQSFQKYLTSNQATLANIEGIWESDDRAYRIGIVKESGSKYWGFLLNKKDNLWTAGKNKFLLEQLADNRYKTTYYYADFTTETTISRQVKNILVMENIYKFLKISPVAPETASQDELIHQVPDYRVEKLDSNNVLLTLPPFTMNGAAVYITEMLKQNDALIKSAKNLIIDLRNNPGGDETSFDSVFPYIANGPIVRKGSKIRATQENLILLSHELKAIQDYAQYKDYLDPKLRDIIRKMQMGMGTMITGPDKTFNFAPNKSNPQKVVILVNNKTASSAESLSLEAKQSSKTILMGTNTKGTADYTEVRDWGLPCFAWRLALPLGYSYRLPLNPLEGIGIKPDVKVPDSEVDWVNFAVKYLNTQK